MLLEGLKAYLECSQDGTPHITGEAELARAQLMGQIDREVLKATGLGMRGVAEPRRRGPGRLGSISVGVVAFKSRFDGLPPVPRGHKVGCLRCELARRADAAQAA